MLKYAFMKNFTTLILLILIAAVGKAQNDTLWQRNLEDVVIKENGQTTYQSNTTMVKQP